MHRLLVSLALLIVVGCQDESPVAPPPAVPPMEAARLPTHTVNAVYLVPADRPVRREYARAVSDAIGHVQIWYRDELGGESFTLARGRVDVQRLPNDASWYVNTPNGSDPALWFWLNVLRDAFALTGGNFFDPDDVWVYYVDALPGCGQVTGAAAGVALLPANDLRGLAAEPTISPCTGEVEPDLGVCRWIGGLAHELGHAFGLPHPPGCEAGDPSCPSGSVMWFGYLTYPDAFLTAAERDALSASPFFGPVHLPKTLPPCTRGRGGPVASADGALTSRLVRLGERHALACLGA